MLAVFGHGGKHIKFFIFGPEYAFPMNCWSDIPEVFVEVAGAMRVVGDGLQPAALRVGQLGKRRYQLIRRGHFGLQVRASIRNRLPPDTQKRGRAESGQAFANAPILIQASQGHQPFLTQMRELTLLLRKILI
jgi:hypothetical protein